MNRRVLVVVVAPSALPAGLMYESFRRPDMAGM